MNGENLLDVKDLSFLSEIENIAIVGVSKNRNFFFLNAHLENFKGKIYAINPTLKEIPGYDDGTQGKIFASIKDVPEQVDFAFITVPKEKILEVIDDCVEKGVKLVSVFTADFSDSGTEEGIRLEKELLEHAQNKVRILGPNGMGLYYPKKGIAWRPSFPAKPGRVGLICQSGGLANLAIFIAKELGLTFSKVFSYGNGADLDFVDLLGYLSQDNETDYIIAYVEGIKEGRGKVLKKVLDRNKKPTILLKAGQTKTGAEAIKTHTASISGENRIWNALFNQYNIIEVSSLENLFYTARLLYCYGPFTFSNVAILSMSGGYGVILTDLYEKHGIRVPSFSPKIQEKLDQIFIKPGTSSRNPLDAAVLGYNTEIMYNVIDIALSDEKIDGLVMDVPTFLFSTTTHLDKNENFEDEIIKCAGLGHKHKKPLIFTLHDIGFREHRERVIEKLNKLKVPVFGKVSEFISLLPKISRYTNRINKK
jgi:acyl-CoA synthetase (NDP forming)